MRRKDASELTRHHYTIDLTDWVDSQPRAGLALRPPAPNDAEALAVLMLEAYRDTIDWEDETIVEARQEVNGFLEHPSADLAHSQLVVADDTVASACLVFTSKGHPFVGYVMTHPDHKGQGVGTATLRASLRSLAASGYRNVGAFITEGNTPSEAMFRTVGAVQRPTHVFHIATREDWDRHTDAYTPTDFEEDGFIHCSTSDQLDEVARAHFARRDDLILLTIPAVEIGSMLVYEDLYEAGEQFPHIYAPISATAVAEAVEYRAVG